MKVLIVIPKPDFHRHLAPLGALYVASVLRENNLDVGVLDLNTQNVGLTDYLSNNNPKYCIIPTSFRFYGNCPPITLSSAIKIAFCVKKNSHIKTILIGPVSSVLAEGVILKDEVDFVIIGEPDLVVSKLILSLENKEDIKNIRGIIFKEKEGIFRTPPSEYPDLNKIPFPARDMVDLDNYIFDSYFSPRVTSILTSRGCPFGCTFCFVSNKAKITTCNSGKFYRATDPGKVVEEMELLKGKYGIKGLKIEDPEFCADKDRVEKICNLMLKKKIKLRWKCQGRVTEMNQGLLKLMKSVGCRSIYYGVESGIQEILNVTDKQMTLEQIKKTFYLTRNIGINADASFLFGLPGDNWERIKETVEFAKTIKPSIATFHVYVPFPGIPLFSRKTDFDIDRFDTYKTGDYSFCSMSTDELERARKYAYRSFYMRPSYIIAKSFEGLKNPFLFKYLLLGEKEGGLSKKLVVDSVMPQTSRR